MGGWAWRLSNPALGDYIVTFQSFTFDLLGTIIIALPVTPKSQFLRHRTTLTYQIFQFPIL